MAAGHGASRRTADTGPWRLEARQSRPRWLANHPARLGSHRRRVGPGRSRLVPRGELRPASRDQGGQRSARTEPRSSQPASRPASWWDAQLARHCRAPSSSCAGPRPRTTRSSGGGATVSTNGCRRPRTARCLRGRRNGVGSGTGSAVRPAGDGHHRERRARASQVRSCLTSVPGPARSAVRFEWRTRSPSRSTRRATCSA